MKLKSQKGSITIFVLIAILFYTAFLLLMYAANTNKMVAIKEKSDILKGIYEKNIDNNSVNDIYNKLTNSDNEDEIEIKTSNSYRYNGKVTFDGTNYIDTGIKLFSQENLYKNFEISFDIKRIDNNVNQNTIVNSLQEGDSPWPGFVIRISGTDNIAFKANCTSTLRREDTYNNNSVNKVKVKRLGRKVYYSINDGEQIELMDYSELKKTFNTSLVFGCSIASNGNPQRFFKGVISNINVMMDEEEKLNTVYEHKERIIFDGTNYTNTGIKLFNQQNINKNFRIQFIVNEVGTNVSQATILNAKDETGSPWPGICLRTTSDGQSLEISASSSQKKLKTWTITQDMKIVYKRINKKLYVSLNDQPYIELNDFSDIPWLFESPLVFGCSLNGDGNPQRYFKGAISNIKVEMEE